VPDALDPATRDSAVLDWEERDAPEARRRLKLVRELLSVRRQQIVPRLAGAAFGEAHAAPTRRLTASWQMGDGATLRLLANLSDQTVSHASGNPAGTLIWGSELGDSVPPWTVLWRIG
jgi:maltooligosyltrehalose trehalohydrolase